MAPRNCKPTVTTSITIFVEDSACASPTYRTIEQQFQLLPPELARAVTCAGAAPRAPALGVTDMRITPLDP